MTVIVNIWLGEIPQFTVWNGIRGKDVGHASILVLDDENFFFHEISVIILFLVDGGRNCSGCSKISIQHSR